MKRKKRKIFQTPEERAAWEAAAEHRQRELQGHIKRIRAELTKGMSSEERAAWEAAHADPQQALDARIERATAELATKKKYA